MASSGACSELEHEQRVTETVLKRASHATFEALTVVLNLCAGDHQVGAGVGRSPTAVRHDRTATIIEYERHYRRALIEQGIYYFPEPIKQGGIPAAHTDADIDETRAATATILKQGL